MREPVQTVTEAMEPPSREARCLAAAGDRTAALHADYLATWPCLTTIEARQPADTQPPPEITVAAWNIERCKRVPESAALLKTTGADIVLATEMDWGMARSGQRHTTRDLAEALGMGYIFGTEFVELGTGDTYETSLFKHVSNTHGLHGNAILSRFPLQNPALIPLDAGGFWFTANPKGDGQFRIGGRMAMAAKIAAPGGRITLASVHFESESDAAGRAAQARTLLARLNELYGSGPCIIGGDLNTAAFTTARMAGPEILATPEATEPCFAAFAEAGFTWAASNTGHHTTRAAPGKPVQYPLKTMDWLFTRGLTARAPAVFPAVSPIGDYLSDHELITTRLIFEDQE